MSDYFFGYWVAGIEDILIYLSLTLSTCSSCFFSSSTILSMRPAILSFSFFFRALFSSLFSSTCLRAKQVVSLVTEFFQAPLRRSFKRPRQLRHAISSLQFLDECTFTGQIQMADSSEKDVTRQPRQRGN